MGKEEADVCELLISHELAMKQLYEIFAATFTSQKGFWQNIAADEQRHADLLTALRSDENAAKWLRYGNRLKPQAIKTSLGYVENLIARAKGGDTNRQQALFLAKDLETALLERFFSKMGSSDLKEIGSVLTTLAEETTLHLKNIMEIIDSQKG